MGWASRDPGRPSMSLGSRDDRLTARRFWWALRHPPLRERGYWRILALVVLVDALESIGVLLQRHELLAVPAFVWILLLLVPVAYAGVEFGLAGSLGAAVTGSVLCLPAVLAVPDDRVHLWGSLSSLIMVLAMGVITGERSEISRAAATQRVVLDQLRVDDMRFRLAFEDNMGAMAVVGLDGGIVRANAALLGFLGRSSDEVVGKSMIDFTHPDDVERSREMNRRLDAGETDQARLIKRYVRGDGSVAVAEVSKSVAKDESGRSLFAVTSIQDISEHEALTEQLAHQALHDSLTGLANRTLLDDRMAHSLARLHRHAGCVAIFLLDLDNFKDVNDTLGHLVGDQLLVSIARRLERLVRSADTVSRFGGDEFVYFAEDVDATSDVSSIATRLRGAFVEPFSVAGHEIRQAVSIGVVVGQGSEDGDATDLLRRADIALYEAKHAGRGRVVRFNDEMSERSSLHFKLSQDMKVALTRREFAMHYQPIVGLERGEVLGFEALMRWCHPEEGSISPEVFIPLAERGDLVHELGQFALESATFDAAGWRELTPTIPGPYISVNLSARQFHDPRLFDVIQRVLAESGLNSHRLAVEVTEGVALSDLDTTVGVLERLKSLEIVTALDDFGTGYSSLAYLARLRPDVIKIDRSFLSGIGSSAFDERVLEALVGMCHRLDMLVLAEGIETAHQLELLRAMGVSVGQGYLFSPPVPADRVPGLPPLVRERWSRATTGHSSP